ncbi:MAG: ParB/RepB/Spo0J family partition protein [Spirochaetota bacterium]
MSKKALGKGIEALLSSNVNKREAVLTDTFESEEKRAGGVVYVPLNKIEPSTNQPRQAFDEETLSELADSVREKGILQPILVEKKDDRFKIITGERRFRAAKKAGLTAIPAIVKSFSEEEKLEIALIENIQREDLTPMEEARAFLQLMNTTGLNQEIIARKVGKKRSTIANSLRLLKLPDSMQAALEKGTITPGHARAILAVLNPSDQKILFNRVISEELSVRKAEKLAEALNKGQRLHPEKKESSEKKQPAELKEMEQRFIDVLGTKVVLKGDLSKGKIEISYFSMEDLERIFELFQRK